MASRSGSEATTVPLRVTRSVPPEIGGGGVVAWMVAPNVGRGAMLGKTPQKPGPGTSASLPAGGPPHGPVPAARLCGGVPPETAHALPSSISPNANAKRRAIADHTAAAPHVRAGRVRPNRAGPLGRTHRPDSNRDDGDRSEERRVG